MDIDDFDLLDDILLSDEEPFEKTKFQISENHGKSEKQINETHEKFKKKKVFEELFGTKNESLQEQIMLVNNADKPDISFGNKIDPDESSSLNKKRTSATDHDESGSNVKSEKKSYSWLGLLEDTSDIKSNDFASKEDIMAAEHPESTVLDSTASSQKIKDNNPILNTLSKKSHFKSLELDINLDIDNAKITPLSSRRKSHDIKHIDPEIQKNIIPFSETKISKTKRDNSEDKKDTDSELEKMYVPSAGLSRRSGFARSKDSNVLDSSFDNSVSLQKKKSSVASVVENLPSWLGGGSSENIDMSTRKSVELANDEKATPPAMVKVKGVVTDDLKEEQVLSSAGEDVLNVFDLKRKQSELCSLVRNQSDMLVKHEQEIRKTALQLISRQHKNITSLVQVIATSPISEEFGNSSMVHTDERDSNLILQLQNKIKQAELEKTELILKLEYAEKKSEMELTSLEDVYKYKLNLLLEREIYLKEEMTILEENFRMKLRRQKEDEEDLVRMYKEKIDNLQSERRSDLQKIQELNNSHRDHICLQELSSKNKKSTISDMELSAREMSLINKEKQLSELEENLQRQKISLESKKATLEEQLEEFDLKCMKERMDIEQQNKHLKRSQLAFVQKQECWEMEWKRENEYLTNYKQEIEIAKQNLIKDEKKITRQKFELAAAKSRLDAFTEMEGITPGRITDVIQARAEVQGAIEEARDLKLILDDERKSLKIKEKKLKQEHWKLREMEEELIMKSKYIERLVQQSNANRDEGRQALRKAKRAQIEVNEKMEEYGEKLAKLRLKEESLMQEKINISKERELLNNQKAESNTAVVPRQVMYSDFDGIGQWTPSFHFQNKDIIDPKYWILKLKAEQDVNPSNRFVNIS